MISNLTQSIRQKFQPNPPSSDPSNRNTIFARDEEQNQGQKRSFFQYRHVNRQRPPRDADNDDTTEEDDDEEDASDVGHEDDSSSSDTEEHSPLLPIFSSAHLNDLSVFSLTHTFRDLISERCDTVLTWEQLRSPQVSQFMIKPIQFEIKENHMNAATHYALLANSLQFMKEAGLQPGNSGTNKTRAMVSELIAIRLLKECNTRELIDALSYDFDPLQGQSPADPPTSQHKRPAFRTARISCIEIAIRANAKRFLSHPLVVKHLEAIWNGTIVFHSAADSMHRKRQPLFIKSYGTNGHSTVQALQAVNDHHRTAILYDPAEASLFKLSRLRVPRYRNILSTISFAILLTLFLFVIQERSIEFTPLELVFWLWAAGYMLDEVIGFNDQGFSLYIANFWNTFDLGILVLLFIHLVLRLYGLVQTDERDRHSIARNAYDILAASAVLLFPRLFSVLDHYRYFSQLIIAFRMMAADMIAIFVLILVFCSGFLVALTFAFSKGDLRDSPRDVAYALLQMLLGFTPVAWDRWNDYNPIGRFILITFLFVCHFVVVTILITVMTNSFMEIVRNANEEHQFLFAVNVISNVKSDALFAYVPPTNVLQWLLAPLRFVIPFRDYIKVNRTIIKLTHFPILWTIYAYERLMLRPGYYDNTDLVESRGRVKRTISRRLPRLMRETSIATYRQEAALEEVFRHPTDTVTRTARSQDRRKSTNVVSSWMNNQDDDVEPPQEEDHIIVDKLERRRFGTRRLPRSRRDFSSSRKPTSVLSDPNDFTSFAELLSPYDRITPTIQATPTTIEPPSQMTDADADAEGDDEPLMNDIEEMGTDMEVAHRQVNVVPQGVTGSLRRDYFTSRLGTRVQSPNHMDSSDSVKPRLPAAYRPSSRKDNRPRHARNASSSTMIYNPAKSPESPRRESPIPENPPGSAVASTERPATPSSKPSTNQSARKTPKRAIEKIKPRPMMPTQENQAFRSTPDFNALSRSRPVQVLSTSPGKPVRRSSLEMDLISDIGDNKAIGGGYVGALPASFASQMNHMQHMLRQSQQEVRQAESKRRTEDSEMFGRLMMARMNTLEEGFREVVHEVREGMKQVGGSGVVSRQRSPERDINVNKRGKRFKERQERQAGGGGSLGSGGGSAGGSIVGVGERPGSGSGKDKEGLTRSGLSKEMQKETDDKKRSEQVSSPDTEKELE